MKFRIKYFIFTCLLCKLYAVPMTAMAIIHGIIEIILLSAGITAITMTIRCYAGTVWIRA